MSTPKEAPTPVPTITAVGVARPRAQGQAMTTTAMPKRRAKRKWLWPCGSHASGTQPMRPALYQTKKVATARLTTIGTNTADTRSANAWMGALLSCADSTSRTIWFSTVSAPTREARTSSVFPMFTVEPITRLPTSFATGRDSPVSIASSQKEVPDTTSPSAGILAPDSTFSTSPRCTRFVSTRCSFATEPSLARCTTTASCGASPISLVMALLVRLLAEDSRYLPSRMKVISIALVSKKSVGT
mmetsp:Transcript_28548/g.51006  ORF Transcript_28548/g.51006 Transcript_28548/m.51006 type:complete len:244 (+) Transcript_28548:1434-2165(+)